MAYSRAAGTRAPKMAGSMKARVPCSRGMSAIRSMTSGTRLRIVLKIGELGSACRSSASAASRRRVTMGGERPASAKRAQWRSMCLKSRSLRPSLGCRAQDEIKQEEPHCLATLL